MNDSEDGPDDFFERKRTYQRKVVPAWNQHTSPSEVNVNNPVVFFFPTSNKKDPEEEGWINPKMYKRRMLSKKMFNRKRRAQKRAWRGLSKRLKDEWRFRRYPRDESGKVQLGQFKKRANSAYVGLR